MNIKSLLFCLLLGPLASLAAQCGLAVEVESTDCQGDSPLFSVNFRVTASEFLFWDMEVYGLGGSTTDGALYTLDLSKDIPHTLTINAGEGCTTTFTVDPPLDCGLTDCNAFRDLIFIQEQFTDGRCAIEEDPVLIFHGGGNYPITIETEDSNIVLTDTLVGVDTFFVDQLPGGRYTLNVDFTEECSQQYPFIIVDEIDCTTISGTAWLDENGNGLRESEEPPVLTEIRVLRGGVEVATGATDQNGRYTIQEIVGGEYQLEFGNSDAFVGTRYLAGGGANDSDVLEGQRITAPFRVERGSNVTGIDAGWATTGCDFAFSLIESECASGANLFALPTNGVPPFEYSLDGGPFRQDTSFFSGLTFEPHTLTMRDANQCTVTKVDSSSLQFASLFVSLQFRSATCEVANGVLSVVTTDAAIPLTYQWSTGETTPTITNLSLGTTYSVTVTELGGSCSGSDSLTVRGSVLPDPPQVDAPEIFLCEEDSITLSVVDPLPDFDYFWDDALGNSFNGSTIRVDRGGFYSVFGVQQGDTLCQTINFNLIIADNRIPPETSVGIVRTDSCGRGDCIEADLGPEINLRLAEFRYFIGREVGGTADVAYEELDGPLVCGLLPGTYFFAIESECDFQEYGPLTVGDTEACGGVSGRVYLDRDADCSLGDADVGYPAIKVSLISTATGDEYIGLSDENGRFATQVPFGAYSVATVTESRYVGQCPRQSITVGPDGVAGLELFSPIIVDCALPTTEIVTARIRRCFENSLHVIYENRGTAVNPNSVLVVTLDDFMEDARPSQPPATREGNIFTFNLGDLQPFQRGRIGFNYTLSCDAAFGQTHCVSAALTPDIPCQTDSIDWSGALVNVDPGNCDGDSLSFLIKNIGDATTSVPVSYVVVEDGIMFRENPTELGALEAGMSQQVKLAANGSTYQVIANQEPNAPAAPNPSAVVEGCGRNASGEFSTGFSNVLPTGNGVSSRTRICRPNIGSYDPNEKIGYPTGIEGSGRIEDGTRLTYELHFQNTGTDTAFTVVVRDTLSKQFDLRTIEFGSASHPYVADLDSQRVLTFTFDNILLPDSSTNLAGSQGVVEFSIGLHPQPIGATVENHAGIYFDFNEPIITEATRHRVAKSAITTGIRAVEAQEIGLSVFPNPTNGTIRIRLSESSDLKPSQRLVVADLFGRRLASRSAREVDRPWSLEAISPGYYLLLVTDGSGRVRGRTGFVIN